VRFAKGHGTGNDFVVLPDVDGALDLTPELVARLCDRRRGIGGDGVLRVVRAAKHPDGARYAADAEWFMDYWNSDGSLAEMCGNGSRVFVRFLLAEGLRVGDRIATRAGLKAVRVSGDEIAVDMGPPVVGGRSEAVVGGHAYEGRIVSMGNPHLVCDVDDLDALDLTTAPHHDAAVFPRGVNVEFVAPVAPGHVRMRVHERGSGETLSCGTGACAVAAVTGAATVDVPGGRLTVAAGQGACWLAGPAVLVATGEIR